MDISLWTFVVSTHIGSVYASSPHELYSFVCRSRDRRQRLRDALTKRPQYRGSQRRTVALLQDTRLLPLQRFSSHHGRDPWQSLNVATEALAPMILTFYLLSVHLFLLESRILLDEPHLAQRITAAVPIVASAEALGRTSDISYT
jgi:hypothetical protein